jgi:hypothetical protein
MVAAAQNADSGSLTRLEILKSNIKKIRGLLTQSQSSIDRAPEMTEGVVKELRMLLEIQGRIEERLLSPVLQNLPDGPGTMAITLENHNEVMQGLETLRKRNVSSETFREALDEAAAIASHHVAILETQVLPLLETLPTSDLKSLDQKIVEFQHDQMESPRYADAQPRIVQNPEGGEQKRKPQAA